MHLRSAHHVLADVSSNHWTKSTHHAPVLAHRAHLLERHQFLSFLRMMRRIPAHHAHLSVATFNFNPSGASCAIFLRIVHNFQRQHALLAFWRIMRHFFAHHAQIQ
ncbi:hypothetical protein L195_g011864 [Trifolium pratense]|uniref:Uncharacterized protein n=1 Tax=Trifolium pratense TaxID=57577 RepID=A0A2K3PIQ6_TRIPR|nr:hypothetical protein L195_g011864 [Trifolium pratense]